MRAAGGLRQRTNATMLECAMLCGLPVQQLCRRRNTPSPPTVQRDCRRRRRQTCLPLLPLLLRCAERQRCPLLLSSLLLRCNVKSRQSVTLSPPPSPPLLLVAAAAATLLRAAAAAARIAAAADAAVDNVAAMPLPLLSR